MPPPMVQVRVATVSRGQVVVAAAALIDGLLVKDLVVADRVEHEADAGTAPVTGGAIVGHRLLHGRLLDLEGGHRDGRRPVRCPARRMCCSRVP